MSLEPSVALAADSPANMMPWAGDPKVIIDRLKWLEAFFIHKLFLLKYLHSFNLGLMGELLWIQYLSMLVGLTKISNQRVGRRRMSGGA